ncbi:hypothetical protein BgiBS90_022665, partial [Biomphalaria glabrata]
MAFICDRGTFNYKEFNTRPRRSIPALENVQNYGNVTGWNPWIRGGQSPSAVPINE